VLIYGLNPHFEVLWSRHGELDLGHGSCTSPDATARIIDVTSSTEHLSALGPLPKPVQPTVAPDPEVQSSLAETARQDARRSIMPSSVSIPARPLYTLFFLRQLLLGQNNLVSLVSVTPQNQTLIIMLVVAGNPEGY
jgi:hypothetical protein